MTMDIIVVNYRTPGDLREFLYSFDFFAPAQPHHLHIMNVCPRSDDLAVSELAYQRNGNITYTSFEDNIGYGKAVNRGVAEGTDDTIAIFNADTVLTPGVLDACAHFLWQHAETGIVGPRQYDENGRITHAGIFGTNQQPQHRGWQSNDNGRYSDVQEAITVSGAAYFVKRSVWETLTACPLAPPGEGAFLETPHYYDETWCSYHAREHGFSVMYYGHVGMIHKWHRSSPVGGNTEQNYLPVSQQMFREACDVHGIEHD